MCYIHTLTLKSDMANLSKDEVHGFIQANLHDHDIEFIQTENLGQIMKHFDADNSGEIDRYELAVIIWSMDKE